MMPVTLLERQGERFLDVPMPEDLSFPHVNDSESFRQMQNDPAAARRRIAELRRE